MAYQKSGTWNVYRWDLQSWTKGRRQIHKIKQNWFFYELFTTDILQFFNEKRQNLTFGWTAVYSALNPNYCHKS